MSLLPVSVLTEKLRHKPSEGDVLTAAYLIERQADQLAAAEAKIAQAPHGEECRVWGWNNQGIAPYDCNCWKSASPVSALDAVRADAWDQGCDVAYDAAERDIELPTNPYRAAQTGATDAQE